MSRTVTALYDTRAEAEAARRRLTAAVDLSDTRIIDQESQRSGGGEASLERVAMSHEDRHLYGEGLRRGGFMLTADVLGHEEADKIIRLLEESPGVDLDQRGEQWRRDGWSPPTSVATPGSAGGSEQRIPIVEEQLAVGTREVERGGARVRSYVREVPVHEQVTLREEHVSVERRPLDQRLSAEELDQSDLLRERNIEVTAMAEEPIVEKQARIREEVVVRKTAEQRTQQVEETVARTEVDVDGAGSAAPGRSVSGGLNDEPTGSSSDATTPSRGATTMAQDNFSSSGLGAATGSARTSATATSSTLGGSEGADTLRPIGSTDAVDAGTLGYQEARSSYQPTSTGTELTVTQQRRPASRPSRSLIIGSAVAGALAGGALPFMLAGRKSGTGRAVEVDSGRRSQGLGGVEVDASRSTDPSSTDRDPSGGSRLSGRHRS